ncbi:FRAS1-related extracellular matrix protein 1-like [Dromaius novaehollandiae]|uniref:FRAS1-related extracellular matrix protein 1-like n=1 Tax=Dromaius novaehollandiae TaxID=8790 RepID=UPI00311D9A39
MHLEYVEAGKLVSVNKSNSTERRQMVYVTENELQFVVPKERDSCKVEVVLNELVTHKVGKLVPQFVSAMCLNRSWLTLLAQRSQVYSQWLTTVGRREGEAENLQIVDNDNLDALQPLVLQDRQHGWITVQGGKSFKCTVKNIKDAVVCYKHDDSDITKDYTVLRIFDGRHSLGHESPINLLPKDDSPPFLVISINFKPAEGEMVLAEKHVLMSSDFDSSDDYMLFKIIKPMSAGEVIRKSIPDGPGILVSKFLQRDLLYGLVLLSSFWRGDFSGLISAHFI